MHEKIPPSGEEEEAELATTVLTCEGDLRDPAFPSRLKILLYRLQRLISDDDHPLCVKKVEPWNSVRVTFSIPREAAQRLRQLAQQGDDVLRQLGILSVQIQGDQVITLTLAGRYGESQEIVLRKSPDPGEQSSQQQPLVSQATASTSTAGEPPRTTRRPSVESSVAVALATGGGCMLESLPGPSNMEATRKNIVQYLSQQGTCSASAAPAVPQNRRPSATALSTNVGADVGFRSPNVVAPASDLPFSAARTNKSNLAANFGPFPFASMQHAMNTKHSSHHPSAAASVPPSSTSVSPQTSPVADNTAASAPPVGSNSSGARVTPYASPFTASAASLLSGAASGSSPSVVNSMFPRTCTSLLNNLHPSSRIVGASSRPNIALSSPLLVNLLQSDAAVAAAGGVNAGPNKMLPPPAPDDGLSVKRKRKPRKPRVDKSLEEEVSAVPLAFAAPASPHLTATTTTQNNTAIYTTSIISSGNNLNPSAFVKTTSHAGYELSKVVHSPNTPPVTHHSSRCNPHSSQPLLDTSGSLAPVGVPPVVRPPSYSTQPTYSVPRVPHPSSLSSREAGVKPHTSPPAAKANLDFPLPHSVAMVSIATTTITTTGSSDGKTKHLINPFTGHLEPMPSDEEDESIDSLPMFPEGELDNSENGQSERSLSDGGKDNLSSDTDSGISKSHTDISQSSTDLPLESSSVLTTVVAEEAKVEITSAVSQQRELKLRLKLKESDTKEKRLKTEASTLVTSVVPPSGRLDVSFVSIPGVRKNSVLLPPAEPKVPPLHISLRGPNAAVVVSPRKEDRLREIEQYHHHGVPNTLEQKKCRPVGGRGAARSLSGELGITKGRASSQREHRRGSKNGCQLERTREPKLLSSGIFLEQGPESQAAIASPSSSSPKSPHETCSDPSSSGGATDTLDSSPESLKGVLHVIKDEVLPISQADFKLNTYEVRNCRARALSLDSLKGLKGTMASAPGGGRLAFSYNKKDPVKTEGVLTEEQMTPKRDHFRQDGMPSTTVISRTDVVEPCLEKTNKSVLMSPEPAAVCNHLPHPTAEQDPVIGSDSGLAQLHHPYEKGRVALGTGRRHSAKPDLDTDSCNLHHPAVTENHLTPSKDREEEVEAMTTSNSEKPLKICNSHATSNNVVLCNQTEANCAVKVEPAHRNSLENHSSSAEVSDDSRSLLDNARPAFSDQRAGSGGIVYSNQSANTNCSLYEGYATKMVGGRKTKTESVLNHQDVFERLSNERLRNSTNVANSSPPSPSHSESLCLVNLNHSSSPVAKIISVDSLPALKKVIQVPSVCLTAATAATTCGTVPKPSLVKSEVKIDNCMLPSLIPSVGDVYCERLSSGHVEDHFVRVGGGGSSMVHHTKVVAIAGDSLNLHALKFAAASAGLGGVVQSSRVMESSTKGNSGLCGGLSISTSAIRSGLGDKSATPAQDKILENGNALSSEESSLDSELSERDSPPGTNVEKPSEVGRTETNRNPSAVTVVQNNVPSEQDRQTSKTCSVVVYQEEEEDSSEQMHLDSVEGGQVVEPVDQSQELQESGKNDLKAQMESPICLSLHSEEPASIPHQDNNPADFTVCNSKPDNQNDCTVEPSLESTCEKGSVMPVDSHLSETPLQRETNSDEPASKVEDVTKDEDTSETKALEEPETNSEDCTKPDTTSTEDTSTTSADVPTSLEQAETTPSLKSENTSLTVATATPKEDVSTISVSATPSSPYATCSLTQSSSLELTVQTPEEVSTSHAQPGATRSPSQVAASTTRGQETVKDHAEKLPTPQAAPEQTFSATITSGVGSTVTGLNMLACNRGVFGGSESNKVTLFFKSTAAGAHQLSSTSGVGNSSSPLGKAKSVPIKLVALPQSCGNLVTGRTSNSTLFEIIGQTSPGSHSNSGSPAPSGGSPVRLLVKTSTPQTSPRTVVVKSVMVTGASQSLKLLPTTTTASRVAPPADTVPSGALTSCTAIEPFSNGKARHSTPKTDCTDTPTTSLVTQPTPTETPSDTEGHSVQLVQHQPTAVCMDLPVIGAAETTQTGDPVAATSVVLSEDDDDEDVPLIMQASAEHRRTPVSVTMQCDLSSLQRTGGDSGDDGIVLPDEPLEERGLLDSAADEQPLEKSVVTGVPVRPRSSPQPEIKQEPPPEESRDSCPALDEEAEQQQPDPVLVFSKPLKRKCSENAAELIKVCMGVEEKRPLTRSSSGLGSMFEDAETKVEPKSDTESKADSKVESKVDLKVDSKVDCRLDTKEETRDESGRNTRSSSTSSRSSSRAEETAPCIKVLTEALESASDCSSEDELSLSELANKSRGLAGPLALALAAERPLVSSPTTRHSNSLLRHHHLQSSAPQSEESEVEYLYTSQVSSGCRSSSNESRSSSSRCGTGEEGGTATAGTRTRSSKRTRKDSSSSPVPTSSAPSRQRATKRNSGRDRQVSQAIHNIETSESRSPLVSSTTTSTTTTAAAAAAVLASTVAGVVLREEAAAKPAKRKTRSGSASTEQPDSTTSSSNLKRRRISKDCHR